MTFILALLALSTAAATLGGVIGLAAGVEAERKLWKNKKPPAEEVPVCESA